jgi:hypothetical protein
VQRRRLVVAGEGNEGGGGGGWESPIYTRFAWAGGTFFRKLTKCGHLEVKTFHLVSLILSL